jgi:hypothetical protein
MIRVTSKQDGGFLNRMYPYWSNAYIHGGDVIVFVGHVDGRPRFFQIDRDTKEVTTLGPLLSYGGTGEGWYFSADGWVYLCVGAQLRRCHPFTGADELVFDYGNGSYRLWQAHSSDSGDVHSATVQKITSDGPYQNIGTVVSRPGRLTFFPALGVLDESQVDASGEFLIVKEDDDNRIITLATGEERRIADADGALGHSDVGPGYVVGEDDQIGACVRLDLRSFERRPLFSTWNLGHVSVKGGRCLLSDAQNLSLVALDGSGVTPLVAHGMTGADYDHQVMAALDPTGQVAVFVSNMGTDRMDAFLVEIGT